ncbi:MAG: DUF547 domain-containing protein [Deltaproteobacteria bacterium]|nr:DUF547 domain-containing protein [Deltaproteobacteria bacterium]MBW2047485.1 DUF547 domain-containing protein [Deltaproteobacteria bacterium]MBW2110816.1 DUF547 domain-containing protein [Deltaproteobacteria bacterium]MBW2352201.1 DUF547 domain-containing protein [Deltaproteobacteria bacterium]
MAYYRYGAGVLGVLSFLITGLAGAALQKVDNRIYQELLEKYVRNGQVDYRGFKEEEKELDRYLEVLEQVDSEALSRDDRFAFYINAYNAWTIKLILTGYPDVKSIKDLGSFFRSPWKKKICRIDGEVISLDQIEHGILRPRFKDPRVHFAINCAAKGCPPLRSVPYEGTNLDQQLDEMAAAFINDPSRNRLERNTLYASRIFDWFEEDLGGDIIGFFLKYARDGLKKNLERQREDIKIRHLDYDWTLNGK